MDRQDELKPQGREPDQEETGANRPDPSQLNAVERIYEHFRKVPLRYLDIFIGLCVAALVIVVAVGVLKARGLL